LPTDQIEKHHAGSLTFAVFSIPLFLIEFLLYFVGKLQAPAPFLFRSIESDPIDLVVTAEVLHHSANPESHVRRHQEVHVIRHQHVRVDVAPIMARRMLKPIKISPIILRREKTGSAVYTALNDVKRISR
jgi:hypothetical protein